MTIEMSYIYMLRLCIIGFQGALFTKLYFFRNLRMRPISYSVELHKSKKFCQFKTIYLIGPSCKL
jgi:hypothetical protein